MFVVVVLLGDDDVILVVKRVVFVFCVYFNDGVDEDVCSLVIIVVELWEDYFGDLFIFVVLLMNWV